MDDEYVVKYDGSNASTPWGFYKVTKGSPDTIAANAAKSLSDTDYMALADADRSLVAISKLYDAASHR